MFDVQGRNIQHGQLNANPIDISSLENGVYLIKVISQNQHTQVLKLVVE
ncbi:T9SS type A sorting domain-containing protein [Mesohalobacter salilacus]